MCLSSSSEIENILLNSIKMENPKFDAKQSCYTYQFQAAALASGVSEEETASLSYCIDLDLML